MRYPRYSFHGLLYNPCQDVATDADLAPAGRKSYAPGMSRPRNLFERNPVLTIVLVNLAILVLLDVAAGFFVASWRHDTFRRPDPNFHHGLKPGRSARHTWGPNEYPIYTDSLGFKDRDTRAISLVPAGKRIVFIGDSFTEGIGYPFEKTFVGLVAEQLGPGGIEVLNAGVIGYSPRLYYLKIKDLIERVGLRFDELYVFIDISDPINELEYEGYRPADSPLVRAASRLDEALLERSALYYLLRSTIAGREQVRSWKALHGDHPQWVGPQTAIHDPDVESYWTLNRGLYTRYAARGLHLAEENMDRLVELCRQHGIRVTLAVYPWPIQIINGDLFSLQVSFWQNYTDRRGLELINFFPAFIRKGEDPAAVVGRYFIPGDDHLNEEGHRLVANECLRRRPTQ